MFTGWDRKLHFAQVAKLWLNASSHPPAASYVMWLKQPQQTHSLRPLHFITIINFHQPGLSGAHICRDLWRVGVKRSRLLSKSMIYSFPQSGASFAVRHVWNYLRFFLRNVRSLWVLFYTKVNTSQDIPLILACRVILNLRLDTWLY